MSEKISLKKIESKAYLAYYQDGIYVLLVGLSFICMALGVKNGFMSLAAIAPVLAILIAPGLKKAITLPRLGYVKFSPQRERKEQTNRQRLVVLMTVTALLGVLVFFGYSGNAAWQMWIRSLGIIPLSLVLAVVASALGLLYDIKRCYLYAAIILTAFILSHILELSLWFQFGLPGIVIFVTGLVLLIHLISQHPKAPTEKPHEV
ncbi:MAG: hypothetical protein OEV55_04095 [candidate division Zixibacteria bacterium]|nr:hypothetical protein [candidate division Zixibacteria bacterium]